MTNRTTQDVRRFGVPVSSKRSETANVGMSVDLQQLAERQLPSPTFDSEEKGCHDVPRRYRETGAACPYCHADNALIKDVTKSERFCNYCGTVVDKENMRAILQGRKKSKTSASLSENTSYSTEEPEQDEWDRWFSYRQEESEEGRIRAVGGYASAYVFDQDF